MPAEYRNPDGTLAQGYYCWHCGRTCNMIATGHGNGLCKENKELVLQLVRANDPKRPIFRVRARSVPREDA